MSRDLLAQQLQTIDGLAVAQNVSSASLCTYRVGGPLAIFVRVNNREALAPLAALLAETEVPTIPIGKGSNLLVADAGFGGVAIALGDAFTQIEIADTTVVAGGAAALPVVARATVSAGLMGFEWAVGVPGSIGGAVFMNAGGHGSDMTSSLVSADVVDLATGTAETIAAEALELRYRHSNLDRNQIVSRATLGLVAQTDPEAGPRQLKEIVAWRRANQPGGANAGSVFRNPPDDSAGRMIDALGLKGYRVGSAEVSVRHANFIQADPDGSADDVMALMGEIVDRVMDGFGIQLHAETQLVGFEPSTVDHVQPPSLSGGK